MLWGMIGQGAQEVCRRQRGIVYVDSGIYLARVGSESF
jgi:hypothetical protein